MRVSSAFLSACGAAAVLASTGCGSYAASRSIVGSPPIAALGAGPTEIARARSDQGCGGLRPHATVRAWIDANARPALYVADFRNLVIYVYGKGPTFPQIGVLDADTGAAGLAVDRHGNLYATDECLGNVRVFAPHATKPFRVLHTGGLFESVSVDVDQAGDVAVADNCKFLGTSCSAPGFIAIFKAGSNKVSQRITPANLTFPSSLAYDSAGNLWLSGQTASFTGTFGEIPAGTTTFTPIALANGPGPVEVDAAGNIAVTTNKGGPMLSIYPPGSSTPTKTFAVGPSSDGVGSLAIGRLGAVVFVGNLGPCPPCTLGYAAEYSYPGGTLLGSVTLPSNDTPTAVAAAGEPIP